MGGIREAVPWWLRIGAKIALARLPVPYSFWKRLRLFVHGNMDQPKQALDVFLEHARTAGVLDMNGPVPRLKVNSDNFAVLELGPGDSLSTAVIAKSLGASRTWLVDAGPFATTDMSAYAALFNYLRRLGVTVPLVPVPHGVADMLKEFHCDYLTEGVSSLARLPSGSVDYCFSNAVLEHVSMRDFFQNGGRTV